MLAQLCILCYTTIGSNTTMTNKIPKEYIQRIMSTFKVEAVPSYKLSIKMSITPILFLSPSWLGTFLS